MLFHQHLDISRLSGGRIVLEKEKCSLTQIFSTNMSRKSERNKPFVRVDVLNLSLSKNKVFLLNVSSLWLFVFVFVWEHSCFHPAPERQSSDVFPPLANSVLTHSFCSDTAVFWSYHSQAFSHPLHYPRTSNNACTVWTGEIKRIY